MMLRRNDRNLENIPVGALGLILFHFYFFQAYKHQFLHRYI